MTRRESTEEWRSIAGYEGLYEVSSLGAVRSLTHVALTRGGVSRLIRGRSLKPSVATTGYLCVRLYMDGASKLFYIHRLVASAFLGAPSPDRPVVCHGDGTRTNNRVDNLRWGTHSDNSYDSIAHGVHPTANKTHCPAGHEYTAKNTYLNQGRRNCRACKRIRRGAPVADLLDGAA